MTRSELVRGSGEPAHTGQAEFATELVRAGRRVATGQTLLISDGTKRVRVLVTLTRLARATGPTAMFAGSPALPPPGDCLDPLAGRSLDGVTIADRIEYQCPSFRDGGSGNRPATRPESCGRGSRNPETLT
jgi:hypothetical protein